jgi:hypothetical protein
MNKKDLIKRLREHPLYKAALKSVDKKQAARIAAITEGFLSDAADGLVPLFAQATDKQQLAEARQILNDRGLVTAEPEASGSNKG